MVIPPNYIVSIIIDELAKSTQKGHRNQGMAMQKIRSAGARSFCDAIIINLNLGGGH
jgi:hypothetical protein